MALKQEKGTNGCQQLLLTPCPWKKLRFHHLQFPSWVTKHPVRITDSLCFFSSSPSFCDTFAFSHNANALFLFHCGGQKYHCVLPENVTTFQKINYQHTNENAGIWQHVKKLCVTVKKRPLPICCCNYGYRLSFDWQFSLNFTTRWCKDTL